MPDKTLHEIAVETREATAALRTLLDHQKRAARRRLIWITVLYVPFAMIVSGLVTVTAVSICFLDGTNSPDSCKVFPGYAETQTRNERLVQEFRNLQERSLRNERRITRLEEKLK